MRAISKFSKWISLLVVFAMVLSMLPAVTLAAEESGGEIQTNGSVSGNASVSGGEVQPQIIETEYSELWNSTDIVAKVGVPVKWYVKVPEGTTPRGCGATIKIPGLGWGTDTYNREEGHITLVAGENFIYEFTPEKAGDILFTCWMGSGCHYNYIHVTEDGTYNGSVDSPAVITGVTRSEDTAEVSFDAPKVSGGVVVTGYNVLAVSEDNVRVRATGTASPITVSGLEKEKSYTITVTAKSTIGKNVTSETYTVNAIESEEKPKAASNNAALTVTTKGDDLWETPIDINAKVGDTITWNVTLPDGTDVYSGMGGNASLGRVSCKYSIKIPDFGMGTNSYNANGEDGQVNLAVGSNTITNFKIDSLDGSVVKLTVNGAQKSLTLNENGYVDVIYVCWMGVDCHSNYLRIHVSDVENKPAKTAENKPAENKTAENKPVENTPAGLGTKTEISGIVVTDELRAAGFGSEAAIKEALTNAAVKTSGYSAENTVVYEVAERISLDGGKTWVAATPDNIPAEGVSVTLPYPDGIDAQQFDFTIVHMFGKDTNGHKAGEMETLSPKEIANGLEVTVKSFSPFAVAWKASEQQTGELAQTSVTEGKAASGDVVVTTAYNHVGDGYYPYAGDDLWGNPVTIRAGVGNTVSWVVTVPAGTDVYGGMGGNAASGRVACNYSIKIPDFGMGTSGYSANGEGGQVNLAAGSNTVFNFKVDSVDGNGNVVLTVNGTQRTFKRNDNGYIDVTFVCWMGADCHSNHIRIYITDDPNATDDPALTTITSPKTGDDSHLSMWIVRLLLLAGIMAVIPVFGKRKKTLSADSCSE